MRSIKTSSSFVLAISLMAGSAIGVIAQDGPADPVAFSGHIPSGSATYQEGAGSAWVFRSAEMSDPRLQGVVTHSHNVESAGDFRIFSSVWRIENEDGAWEGPEHTVILPGEGRTMSSVVLIGEGDYEGLTALAEFTFVGYSKDVRGVIIDGGLPPIPPAARLPE